MTLTKHPRGSLRELWALSFPLMLSSLSVMMMLFVDRLMLAHYSQDALNAAVNAATFGWAFIFATIVIASISEIFVAQYNGAGKKEMIGEPVWQMIWFSLASTIFFVAFGIWGSQWVYAGRPLEAGYLRWMFIFGSSFPLYATLCGFFVGQGKTRLITILAIVANFINAGLDLTLIFGIDGIIPSLGVNGAAIATSGSSLFQVAVLAFVFLKKENRINHGTGKYAFHPASFWRCFKIGFPTGVFVCAEVLGWAAYYSMMSSLGSKYILVAGVSQSIVILCYFFAEGVNKAAATIAGNLIGARQRELIWHVLKNGLLLLVFFSIAMLFGYFFFGDFIINQFVHSSSQPVLVDPALDRSLQISLLMIVVYMFFEGIRLLLTGLLTAAGDTRFLFFAGSLSIWVFMVLPVYLFVVQPKASVELAVFICVCYSIIAALIYFWRFYEGKWKTITITKHELL